MSKTFYFYNCFITYNGNYTNILFSDLIDSIMAREAHERFKSIKQGNLCMIGLADPSANSNDYRDRKIMIGKYRNNKPYLGSIGTDRIDEIEDDVLEITSAFFVSASRLVIVEYNHYGCRARGLEQYLNSFLPSSSDDTWGVEFIPIETDLGFQDVINSNDIRRLEIKLDLSNQDRTISLEDSYESVLGNIIRTTIDSHDYFGANSAVIGFGNGRGRRRNALDPKKLIELVSLLNLKSDLFESVKVKYYSPKRKRIAEIDLKNQGILQQSLNGLENNSGWELICDKIESYYYHNGKPGSSNQYSYEIIESNLPDLIYNEKREINQ